MKTLNTELENKESKAKKASVKSKRELQYKKDHEMVKGKFLFHEIRGGTLSFPFIKYKGDKSTNYELKDGGVYEIPYMVAKHLNSGCQYPVHRYQLNEDGKHTERVGEWVRRVSFQPIGYFDDDIQPTPSLVTIERVDPSLMSVG